MEENKLKISEEEIIEKIAGMGKKAIPELLQALEDDPLHSEVILKGLQKIGDQSAVPMLIELFTGKEHRNFQSHFRGNPDVVLDTIAILGNDMDCELYFRQIITSWNMKPSSWIARFMRWLKPEIRRMEYFYSHHGSFGQGYHIDYGKIALHFSPRIVDKELLKNSAKILSEVGEWEGYGAIVNHLNILESKDISPQYSELFKPSHYTLRQRLLWASLFILMIALMCLLLFSQLFIDMMGDLLKGQLQNVLQMFFINPIFGLAILFVFAVLFVVFLPFIIDAIKNKLKIKV